MILLQLSLNGLYQSSVYLLIALGFALIYRVARFFPFSHGMVFTFGPYFALVMTRHLGFPLSYSIPLAICFSGILGALIELSVYRPARKRGASGLMLLLASLGTYIVLQNLVSLLFSDETQSLRMGKVGRGIALVGTTITTIQIQTMCISLLVTAALAWFLARSTTGKAMRAVANDPGLALCCGVDSNKTILWAFVIGSALAGIGGTLVAVDIDMTPTMGMSPLLMALVAMVIGGIETTYGIAIGALFLGFAQSVAVWNIGSEWQSTVAFIIFLVFLVVRPLGFFGGRLKPTQI